MAQYAAGRQHGQLWVRRGARGGAEDRCRITAGGIDQPVIERRILGAEFAAKGGELVGFDQPGIVILPHAARVGIDDVFEVRGTLAKTQQLVDLLFVLGEHQLGFAVVEEIADLFFQRVAVHAKAKAADGVGGDLGRDPVRPVVADGADDIAGAQAQRRHSQGEVADAVVIIVPGELAPQPEILFAQRDVAAVLFGIQPQQLRVGVGLGDASGVVHHALTSAGTASSGLTSNSSSSPR